LPLRTIARLTLCACGGHCATTGRRRGLTARRSRKGEATIPILSEDPILLAWIANGAEGSDVVPGDALAADGRICYGDLKLIVPEGTVTQNVSCIIDKREEITKPVEAQSSIADPVGNDMIHLPAVVVGPVQEAIDVCLRVKSNDTCVGHSSCCERGGLRLTPGGAIQLFSQSVDCEKVWVRQLAAKESSFHFSQRDRKRIRDLFG
jgi:hypothetical protein